MLFAFHSRDNNASINLLRAVRSPGIIMFRGDLSSFTDGSNVGIKDLGRTSVSENSTIPRNMYLVMAVLLLEPHAGEVHIPVSWSHENVANGSLVSVPLWSRRVILLAVSKVYSSCEFQSPEDDAVGFSDKKASGVYQSYFWDIHTTCHIWLVLVLITWVLMCCLNGIYLLIPDIVQEATRAASVYLSRAPPE